MSGKAGNPTLISHVVTRDKTDAAPVSDATSLDAPADRARPAAPAPERCAHPPPALEGSGATTAASVALVDDDASLYGPIRAVVEDALGSGVALQQHTGGLAALRSFGVKPPDLVLLDISLPDVDGVCILKLMKADPRLRDVPVVMLTANPHWSTLEIAIDAGAANYIFKPFDVDTLVRAILEAYRTGRRGRDEAR